MKTKILIVIALIAAAPFARAGFGSFTPAYIRAAQQQQPPRPVKAPATQAQPAPDTGVTLAQMQAIFSASYQTYIWALLFGRG